MASAAIKAALRGVPGVDAHGDDWSDTIVTQLAAQGIHEVAELNGAVFEDFAFAEAALNGAQKRVIRKVIEDANKVADKTRSPAKSAGAGGLNEGAAALAALLGRKDEVLRGAPRVGARRLPARAARGQSECGSDLEDGDACRPPA